MFKVIRDNCNCSISVIRWWIKLVVWIYVIDYWTSSVTYDLTSWKARPTDGISLIIFPVHFRNFQSHNSTRRVVPFQYSSQSLIPWLNPSLSQPQNPIPVTFLQPSFLSVFPMSNLVTSPVPFPTNITNYFPQNSF